MADTERIWIRGGGQAPFMFDGVLRQAHRSRLETTDNPVEDGVPITDHAIIMPKRLEIEAGVGNVWLGMRDQSTIDAFAVDEAAGGVEEGAELAGTNPDASWLTEEGGGSQSTRIQRAYKQLVALQESAVPFIVNTTLKQYRDMVIEDLDVDQDTETDEVLYFRAQLKQILIRNTEIIVFPPRKAGKTKRQAAKKADNGEKKANPAPPSNISAALNSYLTPEQKAKLKSDPAGLLIELFTGGS